MDLFNALIAGESFEIELKRYRYGGSSSEPWLDPCSSKNYMFSVLDLIRAAITVGRASRADVERFGLFSHFELLYRSSMLFANLELELPSQRLRQSLAFNNLDPSEKGAFTYFLGLCISKLISEQLEAVPYLMHLDVYSKPNDYGTQVRPILTDGSNSRPDLVGQDLAGNWKVIESKGRTDKVSKNDLLAGKAQANKLKHINNSQPTLKACSASYFASELHTAWVADTCPSDDSFEDSAKTYFTDQIDGELTNSDDQVDSDIALEGLTSDAFLTDYYSLVFDLIQTRRSSQDDVSIRTLVNPDYQYTYFPEIRLAIGLYKPIYRILDRSTQEVTQRDLTIAEAEDIRYLLNEFQIRLRGVNGSGFTSFGLDGVLLQALNSSSAERNS